MTKKFAAPHSISSRLFIDQYLLINANT